MYVSVSASLCRLIHVCIVCTYEFYYKNLWIKYFKLHSLNTRWYWYLCMYLYICMYLCLCDVTTFFPFSIAFRLVVVNFETDTLLLPLNISKNINFLLVSLYNLYNYFVIITSQFPIYRSCFLLSSILHYVFYDFYCSFFIFTHQFIFSLFFFNKNKCTLIFFSFQKVPIYPHSIWMDFVFSPVVYTHNGHLMAKQTEREARNVLFNSRISEKPKQKKKTIIIYSENENIKIDIVETDDKTVMLVKIVSNIVSTGDCRRGMYRSEWDDTKETNTAAAQQKTKQVYVCGSRINKMNREREIKKITKTIAPTAAATKHAHTTDESKSEREWQKKYLFKMCERHRQQIVRELCIHGTTYKYSYTSKLTHICKQQACWNRSLCVTKWNSVKRNWEIL